MEIVEIWHIWLIIAVAMVIAEIFSAGACVFLCFSLGCIGSGIGAYFGVDTLKEMVSGKDNKMVYLPYEATGILSSIGEIKDMLKQ